MKKPDLSKITAATAGKTKTTGISPFSELEISKVYPNPNQPRKQFDDIEELASTIKEHGLLQPITVIKKDDKYMIISGERRYKAHLHNQAKTIKAHIVNVTDEAVEELTLIENIQRNDLTDFETAKHIVKLWESGRYEKKSDLAKKIGKSDSYISKAFSSLKLDSEIIDHIEQNKKDISIGVMDEIARVKDKDTQKEVYKKYSDGEITRDEIKEFKPKKLNETFSFSKDVWSGSFLQNIGQDWIINRIKEHENYELRIKEVSTFTDYIQDDQSEISFVVSMTAKIKNAFKDKFDSFITKKSKLLELDAFYKITIKPTGKLYIASFISPDDKEKVVKDSKINHTLERFEDADNDLVEQAKKFSENFPRENSLIEIIDNISLDANVNFDSRCLYTELGIFHINGNISNKLFAIENSKYKLIIESEDIYKKREEEVTCLRAKIQELEKEIEELNNKEVYIVGNRQIKGHSIGGGFRCRALNENEAIEIAKKDKYPELANDKNIIWEARTLKSNCNDANIFNDYIGYGFGTVNDMGTYIGICDGDFKGTITFEENGDFVKTTNNREYQVIIKELDNPIEKTTKPKDKKEIALLELFDNAVTIIYTNDDMDMGIDYKKASKIIDESNQKAISLDTYKGSEERINKILQLLNQVRESKDNKLILKEKA